MLSTIEMAFDLFAKERLIEEKNALLQRSEKAAHIGYWFVAPGSTTITLSEGGRAMLGLESECCTFEDFERRVHADAGKSRSEAFRALIDNGTPYDVSYKFRRGDTGATVTIRSSGRCCDDAIQGVFQDISEIEELLVDLRRSEELQAITLRSIGDGVISTDIGGRVVELNPMAERLTGWRNEEAVGRPIQSVFEIVNASTRKSVENPVQKVIDSGYIVGLANHTVLIARDGSERHIADSAAPIRDDTGAMLGMVLVFRDITCEYEAEETLRRNEEIFRTLFTEAHAPILLIDPETGKIEEANRASARFYGWSRDELIAMNIADINVLPREKIADEMGKAVMSDQREFRFVHRLAGGAERRVSVASGPISVGGKKKLLSIVRDATESHKIESELGAERDRSSVLVRDARHRMKNSAQMMSSLIQLQLSGTEDEKTAAILRVLQSRVDGITLVYEQLYGPDEREAVSSSTYLLALLEAIGTGYLSPSVKMLPEIQDIAIEARFAVSLGLIVGELVMNAIKYAFPSGAAGAISVRFEESDGGGAALTVSDDGIGMQAAQRRDGDLGRAADCGRNGIGLDLVRSLVAQENGGMEIDTRGEGTSITCFFRKIGN